MNKIRCTLIILFLPIYLLAQNIGIQDVSPNKEYFPGQAYSVVLKFTNEFNDAIELEPIIELPDNWLITSSPATLTLAGNSSKIQIITIYIPQITPTGNYSCLFKFSKKNSAAVYSISKELFIEEVVKLELQKVQIPNFVVAGEKISTTFSIKNRGNTAQNVGLNSNAVIVSPEKNIDLKPGELKLISTSWATNANLSRLNSTTINLTAFIQLDTVYSQTVYATTKVIPISEMKADVYKRFPVKVAGTYIYREKDNLANSGFQGEIYGKGFLDTDDSKLLEFKAVGPDQFHLSSFGRYDEYFINYTSSNSFIHAGDKLFQSSYLSEFSRYGRGLEYKQRFNKFELGAFYTKPRFSNTIKNETNISAGYSFSDDFIMNIGHLKKEYESREDATINYVSAKTSLNRNLDVEAEYSESKSASRKGKAYYVQSHGHFENLAIGATYLRASKNYDGYYNNTDFLTGNLRYRISPNVRLQANYHKDARNFERDTLFGVKPYNYNYYLGFNVQFSKTGYIGLYSGQHESKDRSPLNMFHYKEKFGRIDFSQQLGIFELNLEGSIGKTSNFMFETEGNSKSIQADISFERFRSSFNFFGGFLKSNRYDNSDEEEYIYGARINTSLNDKFQAGFFIQNNYSVEDYYRDRSLFELRLDHKLGDNQRIKLISRYALLQKSVDRKDFALFVNYSINFNVPIKKIAEYGTLAGTIENENAASVKGIKLFLNNHTTVTDEFGNFKFFNVVPGNYYLSADKSTIGLDEVFTTEIPKLITIEEGQNIQNLALTNSCEVQAEISITGIEREELLRDYKNESFILELRKGEESYRQIVQLFDQPTFKNLRPGKWQMRMYRNGLNKLFTLKTESVLLDLKSGEQKKIKVGIIKQSKKIKYLQQSIKVNQKSNPNK